MLKLFFICICINLLTGCTVPWDVWNDESNSLIYQPIKSPIKKEKRIALIISNSNYLDKRISKLKNPINDALKLGEKLRKFNFSIDEYNDASANEIKMAIRNFGEKADKNTTVLFFYAGHALQNNGNNYLIPVDFKINPLNGINYEHDLININTIISQQNLQDAKIKIIILDSCRNNLFSEDFETLEKTRSLNKNNRKIYKELYRGGKIGLSPIKASGGSFIAFSTASGSVARDGIGSHSPYMEGILKYIEEKITIESFFKKVRKHVLKVTGENQIPWESNSLTIDFSIADINENRYLETIKENKDFRMINSKTIYDKNLNKTWKILSNDKVYLFEEIEKEIKHNLGENYRLPTKEEIISLLKKNEKNSWGKINARFFQKNERTCNYWTSSESTSFFSMLQMNFCTGFFESHLVNDSGAILAIIKN